MQHCIAWWTVGGMCVLLTVVLLEWQPSLIPFPLCRGDTKKCFEGLVEKIELSNQSPPSGRSVSLVWIKYQLSVS